MKLQKLVYCLHGWHLAIFDEPAINEEFSAWQYGPVNEELYHIFKEFGNRPITEYAESWKDDEWVAYVVGKKNTKFHSLFNAIIEKYMPLTAVQLSSLTHMEGTPWDQTNRQKGGGIIPNKLIKEHFLTLARTLATPQEASQ